MTSTRMMRPVGGVLPMFVLFKCMNLLDTCVGRTILLAGNRLPIVTGLTMGAVT